MDIEQGPIGSVGEQSVKIVGGKLVISASAEKGPVEAEVAVKVSADPVVDLILDGLKKAIPGQFDDMLIDQGKAALKAWINAQG